jgi:hypothetical protein
MQTYLFGITKTYGLYHSHVRLTSQTVTVLDENLREIIVHKRLYGAEGEKLESMEWVPYLSYISKHPRALMNTGIYEMMPQTMQNFLSDCAHTERGKILKTLSELTTRTGFNSTVQTVE